MTVKLKHYGKLLLALLLFIGFVCFSIKPVSQDITAIAPSSQMTLQGQQSEQTTNEEQTNDSLDRPPEENIKQEQQPEQQPPPAQDSSPLEELQALSQQPVTTNPIEASAQPTIEEQPTVKDAASTIEIVAKADREQSYFTTNLQDGMTVTEPSFRLTISQLTNLTLDEMHLSLNDEKIEDFNGRLTFKEGINHVTITMHYTQDNEEQLIVKQAYAITLNSTDIVIQTTLVNATVKDDTYRFTASASRAGQAVPLKVLFNDNEVTPKAGHTYAITLQPGDNAIALSATAHNTEASASYTINYKETKENLTFATDLIDQKVAVAQFSFTAEALYREQPVDFTASLNGEKLATGTFFEVQLQNGTNTIQLNTTHAGEQLTKQYKILYTDPNTTVTQPTDELAPKIRTDLTSGTHVKGLIKTINVWPTTAGGHRIRGKDVAVKVNGVGVPFVWDDAEKTSYKLNLHHGENQVEIRAWDKDGRVAKETFQVTAEDMTNDIIGQVTISIEASVLGIPYLISPTKMDIRQGEKGSYILDQLLRQYGYSYNHTGTLDSNFYLSALKKPNMLTAISIPDDLWLLVEESSTRAIRDDFDPHSLGEFDFANGSGWMFSINGDYPNYGFSDAYFLDGDVVRIRYTLHYGKDISGFGSTGGGSGSNWNKEW